MSFYSSPLVAWTEKGFYCEAGNFYIDPHRAVDTAVVTHAHSDHARRGSKKYVCVNQGADLLRVRLGKNIAVEPRAYGEVFFLGDVKVSFHSAGHILGSAQVRLEHEGEVWVVSGDYKRDPDPSCDPFEVVRCDTFITEATFGTPKYVWEKNLKHGEDISQWWKANAAKGIQSIVFGYSLGKAQRILAELAPHAHRPVLIHRAAIDLTECYRQQGRQLAATLPLEEQLNFNGELILAPPSVLTEEFIAKIGPHQTAFASGWMAGKGIGYGRLDYDHGFVMSDHADWNDLNRTIDESGAKRVFVQHRNGVLIRHLRKKGIEAYSTDLLSRDRYIESIGGTPLRWF